MTEMGGFHPVLKHILIKQKLFLDLPTTTNLKDRKTGPILNNVTYVMQVLKSTVGSAKCKSLSWTVVIAE